MSGCINRNILSLIIVAIIIIMPIIVRAQYTTANCCKLSASIVLNNYTSAHVGNSPCQNEAALIIPENAVVGEGDCDIATVNTCVLQGATETMDYESQEWGTACLINAITNVTNWIFYFFLSIAILITIVAGFIFMTAGGDPTKISKARGLLTYLAIGLVIAALSKVIPTLVRSIIGF